MTASLVDRIARLLGGNRGRGFTARQIATWLIASFPDVYQAKKAASSFIETDGQLINQVVAEIGARKADLQKKYPAVVLTMDKPRRYLWPEAAPDDGPPDSRGDPGDAPDNPNGMVPILAGIRLVLEAVHVLHRRGWQRIRICPGLSASGGYYRIHVSTWANTSLRDGIMLIDERNSLRHTSGYGSVPFGWPQMADATPDALADFILLRGPDLARNGLGRDWPYAGWFGEMLGFAGRGVLPCAFQAGEWEGGWDLIFGGPRDSLPRPPRPDGTSAAHQETLRTRPASAPGTVTERQIVTGESGGDIEESPALASFDLGDDEQRVEALVAFYHQWEAALLAFTAIVWDQLSKPKAARAEGMAALLGLGGKGKTALRKVLSAYLAQTDRALQSRPMPEIVYDGSGLSPDYHEAIRAHFAWMDKVIASQAERWACVLNGDDPDGDPASRSRRRTGMVIQGPWMSKAADEDGNR